MSSAAEGRGVLSSGAMGGCFLVLIGEVEVRAMLGAGPSGPWFKQQRRSRRNNRRGSLGPCRNPTPAPHADQKVTAQCFRLLSRPSRNCCVCFRATAAPAARKNGGRKSGPLGSGR